MALTFGRRRTATPEPLGETSLARHLEQAADERFTGAIELRERPHHGHARLYFFEGGLYSFQMDGLDIDVLARLVSSGALSPETADELRGESRPTVTAVQGGKVSLDALATVHQEYLLAATGAILMSRSGRPHRRPGETSDTLCTVPLRVADVLAAVELRRERLAGTWPVVSSQRTPATAVLRRTAASTAMPSALPELVSLANALDGVRSLDEVASALGLTRAEAVHLAAALVASGHAVVLEDAVAAAPDRVLVPESFGEVDLLGESVAEEATAGVAAPATGDVPDAAVLDLPVEKPVDPRIRALEDELAEAIANEREIAARITAISGELQRMRDAAASTTEAT